MIKLFIFLLVVGGLPLQAAETIDFETLRSAIEARSPALKSEVSEKEAADAQVLRAKGHWLPRFSLNAGIKSTNDPGMVLFSTLGSRSLLPADLNPSFINNPSRQWFKSANAVVDWTLFEGGAKQSMAKGAALLSESQAMSLIARKSEVYAETVRDFGKIATLKSEKLRVKGLAEDLSRLSKNYKVGSKDNPVGYSGLLGMRALTNRLEGVLAQNDSEAELILDSLRIRSGLELIRTAARPPGDAVLFLKEKFKQAEKRDQESSARVQSARLLALAKSEYSMAEKAKWLPRVGIFASENLNSSLRDTGISTEYGMYFQWEIFNASNLGAFREANLRSAAVEHRTQELAEKSEIQRLALRSSLPMLEGNFRRAKESLEITAEQMAVTQNLFRSGSVNALQLTEVLSRRADVIQSLKQIEMSLLDNLSEAYLQNVCQP